MILYILETNLGNQTVFAQKEKQKSFKLLSP